MALKHLELKHKYDIAGLKLNQLRAEKLPEGGNVGFLEFLIRFAQGAVCATLFIFLMAVALTGMRAAVEKISFGWSCDADGGGCDGGGEDVVVWIDGG
jgi:hypothetical protein